MEDAPQSALLARFEKPDDARLVARAITCLDAIPELRPRAIDVASIVAELQPDAAAVAAAVVHEAQLAGLLQAEEIEAALGSEVAGLCQGVVRVDGIHWDRLEEEAAESLRKMFLAIASDVRVVLIALAARVEAMRRLDERPEAERHGFAQEALDVYAPLANRLGIWQLKWELEDLAFRALQPETYREIKRLLAEKRSARTGAIDEIKATLKAQLAEAGINAQISGRAKHIYSIYKKMQRKRVPFDQVYDVTAVRVIVDKVADCYAALGLAHGLWTPIAGEFDDYIAKPKSNFYRSLHTAVIGPDGRALEIQFRTAEMHEYNEYGIAAHWRYKEAKKADRRFDDKINWLRQLMEWQKEVTDPHELAQSLKTDIFQDQVYVFTPAGEVVDLPVGATPLDFAYRIHTSIGHRCRGAKVDGQIVPLDYALRTGQRVEIITAKTGGPSRDWLSPHAGQVRTTSARTKIRQYFRQQEREASIASGRELIERELKRLGLEGRRLDEVLALYPNHDKLDDFLAAVGFGDISTQNIAARLLDAERKPAPDSAPIPAPERASQVAAAVSLAGVDDVLSAPAKCCRPVPGDEVVGFITRGRGVMIHRRDCPNVRNPAEPERLMPLHWGARAGHVYPITIRIVAQDRKGLLRDIADCVASEGVNMTSASAKGGNNRDDTAIIEATLEISGSEQAVRILNKLERMPVVLSAHRMVL